MFSRAQGTRLWFTPWGLAVLLACLVALGRADVAAGQTSPQVVGVEEQWEMVVGVPDPGSCGPQVTTVISPVGNVSSTYAALELNGQSLPDFTPGGLQLQVWNHEEPLAYRQFPNPGVLSTAGETVRWTQAMALDAGLLTFEIRSGTSTTWGNFGSQGYLRSWVATSLENLNAYDPAVSVANSGVGYAANRVQSLVLRSVRLTLSDGQTVEDATARVVHQQQ